MGASTRFSAAIVEKALVETAKEEQNLGPDELHDAAEAAGLDPGAVATAAARIKARYDARSGLKILGIGGGLVLAALVFAPMFARAPSVSVHNEHRYSAYQVELLLPVGDARSSADYCVWRVFHLQPGARADVTLPRGAQRVWARTSHGGIVGASSTFGTPVAVEIERTGHLDQKGLGAPLMGPAPIGARTPLIHTPAELPRCEGAI